MSDHTVRREGDRRRAAKLRERREQAGQVRISAWVPRERAPYARQVLHAAAAGANALPPDPEQQAALDAARAETVVARAELEEARDAGRQADAVALARAEAAERGQEEAARELRIAQAEAEAVHGRERATQDAAAALQRELEAIMGKRGWRGLLLRLAGAGPRLGPSLAVPTDIGRRSG